jgi:CSLREA domain-containing protein
LKRLSGITLRVAAVFALLTMFSSGCYLEDILRVLRGLCSAPNFNVTTTADTTDGLCTSSDCSLRDAVRMSNSCPGTQNITLRPGTYTLTRLGTGEDTALRGDLDITDSVYIYGVEGMPVIDGNSIDRVFDVFPGTTVFIENLIIQHGLSEDGGGIRNQGILDLNNVTLQENVVTTPVDPAAATGGGGGILTTGEGNLTMQGSYVTGNSAFQGGGIAAYPRGASPENRVEIVNSVISGNNASSSGGGLYLYVSLQASLLNVEIGDNTAASDSGDGLWNGSTLNLENVHIYDNRGGIYGGGIYNYMAGHLTASNVLIENNLTRFGGGIYNMGDARFFMSAIVNNQVERGEGGGIFNTGPDTYLIFDNSTISGNQAEGLANTGMFGMYFTTVANNTGAGVKTYGASRIENSILAGNLGGDCAGGVSVSAYNIESTNTCAFLDPSDLVNTDPLLLPLGFYGGTTPIHPLDLGSPAIDSASPEVCSAADQHGTARPQGSRCDRGAYELAPVAGGSGLEPSPTSTPTPTPTFTPEPTTTLFQPTFTSAPLLFGMPSLSLDHFYYGPGNCIPTTLTVQVSISDPSQVADMLLFYHLQDKAGGGKTPWSEGVVMTSLGVGKYEFSIASTSIPDYASFKEAWLLFQFVASGPDGSLVLRSDVFNNATLFACQK